MATTIDAVLAEIVERRAVLQPQFEGLQDFSRLNLRPETLAEVAISIQAYQRRLALMDAAQHAIQALQDDGHPEMNAREVADAIKMDLDTNAATIEAARLQFESNRAMSIALAGGPPVPKTEGRAP